MIVSPTYDSYLIMSIPIPNWASINYYFYYDTWEPAYPSKFYCVSNYFFLIAGVIFFPFALFLCRYTVRQIIEITWGSRAGDVVGHIVGRRVYFFSTLYFVFSSLFWALTIIHGLTGMSIASTNASTSVVQFYYQYNTAFNYNILFLQGVYGNNPLILWFLFGLWAASLELVTYTTYMLLGQKLVHLDQKNDTIPYCLVALFVPLRFIYLFVLRGVGGPFTLYYVYAVNYLMLFIEVCLFWQSGWLLAKKMRNAYELRPGTDGHSMRYFCKLAIAFTAFWLLSLIKYILYCFVASIGFQTLTSPPTLDQISFNLAYIWVSIIQAAISLIIVALYTFKQ